MGLNQNETISNLHLTDAVCGEGGGRIVDQRADCLRIRTISLGCSQLSSKVLREFAR